MDTRKKTLHLGGNPEQGISFFPVSPLAGKHNSNTSTATQVSQEFFRPADACRYLGIGRTKLHNLAETDSDFPRKIHISPRCVGWTRAQLDAWLLSKQREVGV
jgi:predicted DNA-binding transcriptional regulator AlpA